MKGGPDINRTASPGRVCHPKQVTLVLHQATSRINYQEPLSIATWNVRTLFQKGKLENAKQEMTQISMNKLSMAEDR